MFGKHSGAKYESHDEPPHVEPGERPAKRLTWIVISAAVMTATSLTVGGIKALVERAPAGPDHAVWVDTEKATLVDLDPNSKTWTAVVGEDELELRPDTRDWDGSGCTGTVKCSKGNFKTGQFKLAKQPGNLNRLHLSIEYEDGRQFSANLKRTQ